MIAIEQVPGPVQRGGRLVEEVDQHGTAGVQLFGERAGRAGPAHERVPGGGHRAQQVRTAYEQRPQLWGLLAQQRADPVSVLDQSGEGRAETLERRTQLGAQRADRVGGDAVEQLRGIAHQSVHLDRLQILRRREFVAVREKRSGVGVREDVHALDAGDGPHSDLRDAVPRNPGTRIEIELDPGAAPIGHQHHRGHFPHLYAAIGDAGSRGEPESIGHVRVQPDRIPERARARDVGDAEGHDHGGGDREEHQLDQDDSPHRIPPVSRDSSDPASAGRGAVPPVSRFSMEPGMSRVPSNIR